MSELVLHCAHEKDGIRILQGYGDLTRIRIPDRILDHPVREIGPYCFSASEPGKGIQPDSDTFFCSLNYNDSEILTGQKRVDAPSLPPLMGRYLEEVYLPPGLSALHNAAFYNCRQLSCLAFGPELLAIGSDVFTNCSKLKRLLYQGTGQDAAALSLILDRLEGDITAVFTGQPGMEDRGREPVFALFFPEYYEWLDEVTPAHLFSRSIHGEGFRMRKCIKEGRVYFDRYDACFAAAQKTESAKSLCRIAGIRLRYPAALAPAARSLYEQALLEHYETATDLVLSIRSTGFLTLLLDILTGPEADRRMRQVLEGCIRSDWGEGAALVMEQRGQKTPVKKTYIF